MLCHLPGGDAMAENSLSFGCWGRTGSSELRPPPPRIGEAAVPARVAFHLTCGVPGGEGKQEGRIGLRHIVCYANVDYNSFVTLKQL